MSEESWLDELGRHLEPPYTTFLSQHLEHALDYDDGVMRAVTYRVPHVMGEKKAWKQSLRWMKEHVRKHTHQNTDVITYDKRSMDMKRHLRKFPGDKFPITGTDAIVQSFIGLLLLCMFVRRGSPFSDIPLTVAIPMITAGFITVHSWYARCVSHYMIIPYDHGVIVLTEYSTFTQRLRMRRIVKSMFTGDHERIGLMTGHIINIKGETSSTRTFTEAMDCAEAFDSAYNDKLKNMRNDDGISTSTLMTTVPITENVDEPQQAVPDVITDLMTTADRMLPKSSPIRDQVNRLNTLMKAGNLTPTHRAELISTASRIQAKLTDMSRSDTLINELRESADMLDKANDLMMVTKVPKELS